MSWNPTQSVLHWSVSFSSYAQYVNLKIFSIRRVDLNEKTVFLDIYERAHKTQLYLSGAISNNMSSCVVVLTVWHNEFNLDRTE